ncbi:MAG: FG-GAP-like repeat-containing protein [Mycobacteriales bacterium]
MSPLLRRSRIRRPLAVLALSGGLVAGAIAPLGAGAASASPSPIQTTRWSTPTYNPRYTWDVPGEQFSSPSVLYYNGKTYVTAGFPNGHIYVWNALTGGRVLDRYVGPGVIDAAPTIVDFYHDGLPDIVTQDTNGDVVGFTLRNKTIFKAKSGVASSKHPGNFSATKIFDVNKDGHLDVIQTSWDGRLHIWDGRYLNAARSTRELPGFPYVAQDTIWSSPVIADLNHDGRWDVVFGYDCDGVYGQRCYKVRNYYNRGGYVTAINTVGPYRGEPLYGWPRFVHNQTVWSSPAITDLNRDGKLDVVVGTGNMMTGGQEVLAYDHQGNYVNGWPVKTAGRTTGSPAVGDLDGDGKVEVVEADDSGYLYVFNSNGTRRFVKCVTNSRTGCGTTRFHPHASPIIANVLGARGHQQVIVGGEQHLYVFDGSGTERYRGMLWWTDRPVRSVPFTAAPTYAAVPGRTSTIYVAAGESTFGEIFGWSLGTNYSASAWPTFQRTFAHAGR